MLKNQSSKVGFIVDQSIINKTKSEHVELENGVISGNTTDEKLFIYKDTSNKENFKHRSEGPKVQVFGLDSRSKSFVKNNLEKVNIYETLEILKNPAFRYYTAGGGDKILVVHPERGVHDGNWKPTYEYLGANVDFVTAGDVRL